MSVPDWVPPEWRNLVTPEMLERIQRQQAGTDQPPTREEFEKILRAAVRPAEDK